MTSTYEIMKKIIVAFAPEHENGDNSDYEILRKIIIAFLPEDHYVYKDDYKENGYIIIDDNDEDDDFFKLCGHYTLVTNIENADSNILRRIIEYLERYPKI